LQGNQDAHRGLLPLQHAAQVAHVFDARLAAFDLDDDLLRFPRLRFTAEKNLPVNAVVRTLRQFDGPCANQAQGPPLELDFVLLGQDGHLVECHRFAQGDDLDLLSAVVAQAVLDERGGQLGGRGRLGGDAQLEANR
jgi:hypothetical protein